MGPDRSLHPFPFLLDRSWILFVMFLEATTLFGARFAVMVSPPRASTSPTHD
jgi:hypothetical protein